VAAILQIVAAVGSTTALLDLNDNPAGILVQKGTGSGSGLSLADVTAGDDRMPIWTSPGGATVPEATARTITVPVHLLGSTPDAVGTKVQTLVKLLGQPWVLRVRRSGASVDGWIRCYPTIPQIDTDITGLDQQRAAAAGVIVADTEPYAYGARVDKASTTVPTQDASTAGAFVLDVTGVAGDAPTPAFVRCSDTTLIGAAHGTLLAIRRSGTPASLTGLSTQAEAGTGTVGGANVTVTDPFVDATLSGGNGIRYAYAAAYVPASGANYGRVVYTPSLTGAEAPGLYKLLVRARRSTSDEFTFWPKVAGLYALDSVLFPAGGTNTRMIDLGIVQLPAGQPQQLAAPTPAVIGADPPSIQVDIWKTTGTAASNLDLDYFLLVPCDEDAGVIYQSAAAPASSYLTVDGFAQDAYLTTGDPLVAASTGSSSAVRLDYVGGVPRLYPGVTNRLLVVTGFNSVGSPPALTQAPAFLVSHWPRYTWLP
jgi:hypothetical protein